MLRKVSESFEVKWDMKIWSSAHLCTSEQLEILLLVNIVIDRQIQVLVFLIPYPPTRFFGFLLRMTNLFGFMNGQGSEYLKILGQSVELDTTLSTFDYFNSQCEEIPSG